MYDLYYNSFRSVYYLLLLMSLCTLRLNVYVSFFFGLKKRAFMQNPLRNTIALKSLLRSWVELERQSFWTETYYDLVIVCCLVGLSFDFYSLIHYTTSGWSCHCENTDFERRWSSPSTITMIEDVVSSEKLCLERACVVKHYNMIIWNINISFVHTQKKRTLVPYNYNF